MHMSSSCRAQSVIEYLLIVTAVVLVLISGILVKNGVFVRNVNTILQSPGQLIDEHKKDMTFKVAVCEVCGEDGKISSCVPQCKPSTIACGAIGDDGCMGPCVGSYCAPAHGGANCKIRTCYKGPHNSESYPCLGCGQ